eukprot:TRINITY_DN104922_c0_g1_i1.p1 TRINITY_DN104922_c0_g1~~TRINITY_DN104922_c0_g1_i1.p1  ORF type:complete len:445 (-),score=57.14 TRINITY_DN104922_c0_g1_i1:855-2105(-)
MSKTGPNNAGGGILSKLTELCDDPSFEFEEDDDNDGTERNLQSPTWLLQVFEKQDKPTNDSMSMGTGVRSMFTSNKAPLTTNPTSSSSSSSSSSNTGGAGIPSWATPPPPSSRAGRTEEASSSSTATRPRSSSASGTPGRRTLSRQGSSSSASSSKRKVDKGKKPRSSTPSRIVKPAGTTASRKPKAKYALKGPTSSSSSTTNSAPTTPAVSTPTSSTNHIPVSRNSLTPPSNASNTSSEARTALLTNDFLLAQALQEEENNRRQRNGRHSGPQRNNNAQAMDDTFGGMRDESRDDIALRLDNMTYEELLSLGDRIGKVSKGITPELISTLPTYVFHDQQLTEEEKGHKEECSYRCTICLEDYEDGEVIRSLMCFHQFHCDCVDSWLKENSACPVCKHDVKMHQDAFDVSGSFGYY